MQSNARRNHCSSCKKPDYTTKECEIFKQYLSINTDESNRNATKETINDTKIQNNKIKATNIERYNGNEVITENEVNKNKQETNIIEKFLIINAIIESFIKIN